MVSTNDDGFAGWAIVEVVGRKQYAGLVREQLVAGAPLLRIDVPEIVAGAETIPGFTKFVGPGSIYMLTPTDEATARRVAADLRERPVHLWQMQTSPRTALQRATDDDASDDYNPDSDQDIPDGLNEDLDDDLDDVASGELRCSHCHETILPSPESPARMCGGCAEFVHERCVGARTCRGGP